jgi:hypothetical protein
LVRLSAAMDEACMHSTAQHSITHSVDRSTEHLWTAAPGCARCALGEMMHLLVSFPLVSMRRGV